MHLSAITVGLLRHVIALYGRAAWAGAEPPAIPVPGRDDDPATVALPVFRDETLRAGDQASHRYTLQLGNPGYKFMKLVLAESLVQGEYVFEVDTHDQMFRPEEASPEEKAHLLALKRFNLDVKEAVERTWQANGVPTAATLQGLVETWPIRREPKNGKRILLVDDNRAIAATLALLLEARGYEVSVCHDGREAVELAHPARHDLVLMDNEMTHLNGFEACRVLKSRPETRSLPVLIATAGSLTLQQLDAADGFLVKPFRLELLFSILDDMLGKRERL